MKKIISVVMILMLILLFPINMYASKVSDLNSQLSEAEKEIQKNKEATDAINVDKTAKLKELEGINSNIDVITNELAGLNSEIDQLNNQITMTEKDLQKSMTDFDKQEKLLYDRLIVMYENGDTKYLDVLLSSSSITDFISNYYLCKEITSYDMGLLSEIENEKQKIEDAKNKLEVDRNEIASKKAKKQSSNTELNNAKKTKNTQINNLNAEEKKLQNEIEAAQKEIAKIKSEIDSIISTMPEYIGGVMTWPVPGYYNISCGYLGYQGHYGIDITGGSSGSVNNKTAVAAADGKVIISKALMSNGQYYSYGNYVVIDHGGGIRTLYAHMNSRAVSVGQNVKKGQTIGAVGSTGNSTGPHLHFEVIKNGKYVNPLTYLKK